MSHYTYEDTVLIIGAGLAGLGAANYLAKQGISATLIEARDRAGGRVFPDATLGVPLGRGASWIHGIDGNPMAEFFSLNGKNFFSFNSDLFYLYNREGQRISPELIEKFNIHLEKTLQRAKDYAYTTQEDSALSSALAHVMVTNNLSLDEKDIFFKKLKFFENYIGDNYQYLSAWHWNDESEFPGQHGILSDGYESILRLLTGQSTIHFNTRAESITLKDKGVEVATTRGIYYGKSVIVTVPLGVLKQGTLKFFPNLSVEKKRAIEKLGMGLFNIIAMRFSDVFWDNACHAFFLPEEKTCSIFFNLNCFVKCPILIGYVGGDTARLLELQTDALIIENILTCLGKYFNKPISSPESYFITRWNQDPFSLGSYSYHAVGSSADDRDVLANEIENRIYFAGEATHREYYATTHGAYLSGVREAEKIISKLI